MELEEFLNDNNIYESGALSGLELDFEGYDFARAYKDSNYLPEVFDCEEQYDLFLAYNKYDDKTCHGAKKIRNRIIEMNMKLVSFMASRYSYYMRLDKHELECYGYEGLIKAVENFDVNLGFKFSKYAYLCIRFSILRGIPEMKGFRRGNFFSKFMNIKKTVEMTLSEQYDREINIEESPEFLDEVIEFMIDNRLINKSNLTEVLLVYSSSLDEMLESDNELDVSELISDNFEDSVDEKIHIEELKETLSRVLDTLGDREKNVIIKLYGLDGKEPLTQSEVAKLFGLSRGAVSVYHNSALKRLRFPTRASKLRKFY